MHFFQHDTTKKTKRQKEANVAKKKELDVLKEELVISENELSDIRKVCYTNSIFFLNRFEGIIFY